MQSFLKIVGGKYSGAETVNIQQGNINGLKITGTKGGKTDLAVQIVLRSDLYVANDIEISDNEQLTGLEILDYLNI